MQLPQIRLTSQSGKINLDIQKPVQSIEQPQAILNIQQPKAEMTIERVPSQLTIDQTKAREDMDLKSIRRRIEEAAQRGKQDLLEGIARRAQDGEQLMKIENGGHPIADLSKRNSQKPERQFNIGWIPSAGGVSIQFVPGKVNIDVQTHGIINNSQAQKPIHEYQPGKVNVSMEQYPSLTVDFINLKYKGIQYEQEI